MQVDVREHTVTLPTYRPAAADRNPMFLEKRVYQGSSGRTYPLPFVDRIAEQATPMEWQAITLENAYVRVLLLPQIGGRVHRFEDKTNGYDVIYYQPVIKPALVGLAGPWISGGIEFNWPQHHRPATFMPVETHIERDADGSVTVWHSDHDPLQRMKGMHGVCLRPNSSLLELKVRAYNRTDDVQTFLWWANVATEVHSRYQSFFPEDATFVADHAKRAMSSFPLCTGNYYGVDYGARALSGIPPTQRPRQFRPDGSYAPNDLSWYANIPVPTSYMCMGTREDFFGGYDHARDAGILHWADHHIAPGKKQWTWGNHEFGYAWDRNLTDADANGTYRPYIELMAGVYTDNQPDFSFLLPGETKTWSQYWYPLRGTGKVVAATRQCALGWQRDNGQWKIGLCASRPIQAVAITIIANGQPLLQEQVDLAPDRPWQWQFNSEGGQLPAQASLQITDASGRLLLRYTLPEPIPAPPEAASLAALAATEPPQPADIASNDERYLTGLHLEQYRHATRSPLPYWQEALRQDPGDCRCHTALGRWHLRRAEFALAAQHLQAAVQRLTLRNPNPEQGEAHFHLGRCLRWQGLGTEATEAFAKAAWNAAWRPAAQLALAELAASDGHIEAACDHLKTCLRSDPDNLLARNLFVLSARQLPQRKAEAEALLRQTRALDPLDIGARWIDNGRLSADTGANFDWALDLARAGFKAEASAVLLQSLPQAAAGSLPMLHYALAWLGVDPEHHRQLARLAAPDYCFPSRLDEFAILQAAIAADPLDARAHFFLGLWLYDRRRHLEAMQHWQIALDHEPDNAVAWRCLGIAAFNITHDPERALQCYQQARITAPDDARLLYEQDQLWKRLGIDTRQRLDHLRAHAQLVHRRDDLTVEFCALLNQQGADAEALQILTRRRFQPWEGGEGQALAQYVRACLHLSQTALQTGDPQAARTHAEAALRPPASLSEAHHPLANTSEIHYAIGCACQACGDAVAAIQSWRTAAAQVGDFADMEVKAYSPLSLFSARALLQLGERSAALQLIEAVLAYANELSERPAKIDYFATSLPDLLLFDDDLQARQTAAATALAQAAASLRAEAAVPD